MTIEVKKFSQPVIDTALKSIKFDARGLVPAIAQQFDTGEILMMAWMNEEAVIETLRNGQVCYYSRSRGKLWRKGEESGQTQALTDFRVDCDGDTILMQVDQTGVACHTGRQNCFFYSVTDDGMTINAEVVVDPKELYTK